MQTETIQLLPIISGLQPSPETWQEHFDKRSSSVLLLFIPGNNPSDAWQIVFTRRSIRVRTHKGQIGLPGGRREISDQGPITTALRETEEEIGLKSSSIKILGSLSPQSGLDKTPILPIIGIAEIRLTELKANPDEVAEIFALPWPLFAVNLSQTLRILVFGRWRETPYFAAMGYDIWGLTASIITRAAFNFNPE